jgi:AraC-like DNA-binding protein
MVLDTEHPASDAAPPASDTRQHTDEPGRLPVFSSISCTVLDAGRHAYPPTWRLAPVTTAHYRLFVAVAGRAAFRVGEQPYRLEAGAVLLVPPRALLEARQDPDQPLDAFVIDFEARLYGLIDVPAFCGLPVWLMPSLARRQKIADSAFAIVRHLTYLIPGYQLAVHTHCVRLLDLLWKETLAQTPDTPGDTPAAELLRLRPALHIIETRYAERLTLAELASTVHLNPAYFATVFRQLAGMPPHQYLARYRVQRARDLLLLSKHSLDEIASLTGFYDAAHLIRVFQRVEGISPGRFRKLRPRRTPVGPPSSAAEESLPPGPPGQATLQPL